MRLKAARMDLMPVHTAQSPEFIASVQEADARASRTASRAATYRPDDLEFEG